MRMCETDAGTWLIGSHAAEARSQPLRTRQYILRSEDRGETWAVLPAARPNGWCVPALGRMDEGRPINLGGGRVLAMFRTPEGHLWSARSSDDGRTWTAPAPTSLVHPDAPPMLFRLADAKTLIAFHHNRHSQTQYVGLSAKMEGQTDRSELWVATSTDEGRTWSEPRFVLANALAPAFDNHWRDYQCSYLDLIVDGEDLHLFFPHRWQRAMHLRLRAANIVRLPTKAELTAASGQTGRTASGHDSSVRVRAAGAGWGWDRGNSGRKHCAAPPPGQAAPCAYLRPLDAHNRPVACRQEDSFPMPTASFSSMSRTQGLRPPAARPSVRCPRNLVRQRAQPGDRLVVAGR